MIFCLLQIEWRRSEMCQRPRGYGRRYGPWASFVQLRRAILHNTSVLPRSCLIEDSERWAVRDEHVKVIRNQIPVPSGGAARIHERPAKELGRIYGEPQNVMLSSDTPVFFR